MNWFGDYDRISIGEQGHHRQPLMIFGDNNRKLEPRGPFLQLRHEFEKKLLASNTLIIVGYSFGDEHLNTIVRRWTSTRKKAKLVVVDPSPQMFRDDVIGRTYTTDAQGQLINKVVDITHVQKPASLAINDVISASERRGDWEIDRSRSGFIPQIFVRHIGPR